MPARLGLVVALALVVVGCGDDGDTTTSSTTSTTEPSGAATSTTAPEDLLADAQRCTSPDGFTIAYPSSWEAVADCGQFGPAPIDEPEPGTDERSGVVSAFVDRVPFHRVAEPEPGEQARGITVVDGRQAVRVEQQQGEGLYPEGTQVVRWIIDLAIGEDDGDGTLVVDAVDVVPNVRFDLATRVLDAMARSLQITAGDEPEDDGVIARYEGGGAPFTVAAAPSATTPATCFRLLGGDSARPACVEAVEGSGDVAIASIDRAAGRITVGIASPDVWAIDAGTNGTAMTYLTAPYPARDSRAFALPLDPDGLTTLTARSSDGTVISTTPAAEALRPA